MPYRHSTTRPSSALQPRKVRGGRIFSHTDRVRKEMRKAGVTAWSMLRQGSLYLPRLIQRDEALKGITYGRDTHGDAMLVATDQRILYLATQGRYTMQEDIDYAAVSGISYYNGLLSSVLLHTPAHNYRVHTFNQASAVRFINYIEKRCLDTVLGPSKLWKAS